MTHVLKVGPAERNAPVAAVYADPSPPLAPELVSAVVAYVRAAAHPR